MSLEMTLGARVKKLESEMLQVRKVLHSKDEDQHRVWNDLQQELLTLSKQNADRLDRVEGRLGRIESDVSTLKSDMSEVKSMLQALLDRR